MAMIDDKFYKLPCRLAQCKELNGNDKIVFSIIADRLGQHERWRPGIRALAKDAGVNQTTIIESVKRLKNAELIEVESIGNGRRQHYKIVEKSEWKIQPLGNFERLETSSTTDWKPHTLPLENSKHTKTDQLLRLNKREIEVEIPAKLISIDGFESAWNEWLTYRRERKLTTSATCLKKQLIMLEKQPDPIAVINKSIESGWQGLFELKGNFNNAKSSIGNRQFREANRQQGKFANYGETVNVD